MALLIANPIAVLREEFDDYAILFNPDTGSAMGVNPTGVAVWKRLDGKHTLAQIASEITPLFLNTPDNIQGDVERFAQELLQGGFAGNLESPQEDGGPLGL